ncbi:MAG: hypothetical protein K6T86_08845 [Pirellulales bacterium]|nr:hypothetical protein [Pirellulales bacterium]
MTRPSVGLTRVLAKYAASRKEDGLTAGIVWLQALAKGDRRQVLEDLAWCLLCSEEFMMNH